MTRLSNFWSSEIGATKTQQAKKSLSLSLVKGRGVDGCQDELYLSS